MKFCTDVVFGMRFGLVHVDYETLERTPKASTKWSQRVITNNEVQVEA